MALSSSSEHWRRLEALFYEALHLKAEARTPFLDQRCGTDTELRKEVENLLKSAEQTMDFLQKPVLDAAQEIMNNARHDSIGGDHEILNQLSSGIFFLLHNIDNLLIEY